MKTAIVTEKKQVTKKPDYFNKHLAILSDWRRRGVTVDTVSAQEGDKASEIRLLAMEQTGLTSNEFNLISLCRVYSDYGLFALVNVYFHLQSEAIYKYENELFKNTSTT